jgi:hypothetical protein
MVILSLPSMSNSFVGHPDRDQFSAESGQATLIQINYVRYRTLILPPPGSFAMPKGLCSLCRKVFIVALKPIHGRPPSNPAGANFALAPNYSYLFFLFFFARTFRPDICRGRWTPVTGRSQQMIKNKRGRTIVRSALYFSPSSIINLRFFHGQVE